MRGYGLRQVVAHCILGILFIAVGLPGVADTDAEDLMDQIMAEVRSGNPGKAIGLSGKLIDMGEEAIPLLQKGARAIGHDLEVHDRILAGIILRTLRAIKTEASTRMLLELIMTWKDVPDGDGYIVTPALAELADRQIDCDVNEGLVSLLEHKLQGGRPYEATQAAHVLAKIRRLDPAVRIKPIVQALKIELMRLADPNYKHVYLPRGGPTESLYKFRQYILSLRDVGPGATEVLTNIWSETSPGPYKDCMLIALCLVRGSKALPTQLKSKVIALATGSSDGELRALAIRILGDLQDGSMVPIFEAALDDNYKIRCLTDVVRPGVYRGPDGSYYKDTYPVREEAFSALLRLGIKVRREGDTFTIER